MIEEKGRLAVIWSAAERNSERREGPKDAVDGTAVVARDQARAASPIRSRAAHLLRRSGIGTPLLSTDRVEGADSPSVGQAYSRRLRRHSFGLAGERVTGGRRAPASALALPDR